MLGIRTRGGRMESANESTELRRHPLLRLFFIYFRPFQTSIQFFNGPITVYCLFFRPFLIPTTNTDSISTIYIEKSIDGLLEIRTEGISMAGADETTEPWRPPRHQHNFTTNKFYILTI